MKRILLVGLVLSVASIFKVSAQQEPQLTHFMFTKLLFNPAYAGSNDGICFDLLNHTQYSNFKGPEGETGPRTQGFDAMGSIDQQNGVGFHAIMDKEAWVGMTSIYGSYSFKPDFSNFKSSFLSNYLNGIRFGLNAGMIQKTLAPQWKPRDPGDPRLPGTTSSSTWDLGAGIYYDNGTWWASLSALHLPGNKVTWTTPGESADYYIARTTFIAGGYNYKLRSGGGKIELRPSVQIKMDQARTSYSINGMILYDKKYWGALNYRAEQLNAFTIMAGLYPLAALGNKSSNGGLKIGYAYDIATNHATAFGGTSEIYVGYCFTIKVSHPPKVTPIDTRHLGHDPF